MNNKKIDSLIKRLKRLQNDYPHKFTKSSDESSDDDCGGDN